MKSIVAFIVGCTSLVVLTACQPGGKQNGPNMSPDPESDANSAPVSARLCRAGLPQAGNWKCDPIFGDVNQDGHLDLAGHVRLGKGPRVWLGDGQGNWEDASNGLRFKTESCGGGIGFADVNNDGLLDLVVADHCQGVFVYLGDGAGNWEVVTSELFPQPLVPEGADVTQYVGAEDIAVGDINGDGNQDLIAGASDNGGGISVYLGDGTGRNWQLQENDLPNRGWTTRVVLADINGDKIDDLVASHAEGPHVWLSDGKGNWEEYSHGFPRPDTHGIYHGLDVGDVNNDGRADVAVANWFNGPEVFLQREDGWWVQTPDVFPNLMGGAYGLALGDIDQDGNLDVVTAGRLPQTEVGYVYGVFVLLGDGTGSWRPVMRSGLPTDGLPFTWGVALADFNDDGVLDIATGSGGTVATNPQRLEPTLDAGMLAWCLSLPQP